MKIGFIKNHVIGGISLVKVGINVVQQKISISAKYGDKSWSETKDLSSVETTK